MDENIEKIIILEHIKDNIEDISDNDREFFIRYIISKSKLNPNETYYVNENNFLNDLKKLTDLYIDCVNTSLTAKRMSIVIELFNKVSFSMGEEELIDLSIELDKLFIDSGLPVRNTDTVLRKIKFNNEGSIKNGR